MKKLFTILAMCIGVFALNAQNAKVVLTAGDVWGDGSGYQMLINSTNTVDVASFSYNYCSHADEIYLPDWDYTIPANAANGNIVINSSSELEIPAGTYTYAIVNPSCYDPDTIEYYAYQNWLANQQYYQDTMGYATYDSIHDMLYEYVEYQAKSFIWVAGSECDAPKNTMDFEANKTYTFTLTLGTEGDCTTITVTGGGDPTPGPGDGISETDAQTFGLYPNPATEILNVKAYDAKEIEIVNLLGQTVITTNVQTINVASLTNGVYFVRVNYNNGTVSTQKFVKE